ncbi:beta-ketoacyl synthase chain length factor [Alteromonas flava]|uniref:beta-ketoacyl synthase chain length factor n=1 Tax=Alteromonas flava TaxID=2048003 RepID=UPI000C293232|nr:beta-ketoacyl synthase chain length factor [Alteromonas flava]
MQANQLTCKVASIGTWNGFFEDWTALQALLNGSPMPEDKQKSPKPGIIPANERRRAPLPVKLAIESSMQATLNQQIDPKTLTCVFVSGLGDTDLTDYMCKVLASDNKELSPTKFHNSVHNAAAGYWTISTETMSAANSIAGYQESVSLALFEAMVQCQSENVPILVTFYDAPVSQVLQPLLHNQEAFAFSLVLYPTSSPTPGQIVTARVETTQRADWPSLKVDNEYLHSLYQSNPTARVLCLAELLNNPSLFDGCLTMPLSDSTTLSIQIK